MRRPTFITWDQLRVGLVLVVALLVLVVAALRLGSATNLFASRYELIALLPEAGGLREGGQVLVAGQLAGTISRITFLPVDADTTRNLRVVVSVDRKLMSQVRENSSARIRTLGLLGDRVLDISPGTLPYAALQPGDTILVHPALDYEAVLAQAAGAVDDLVLLTADLREITGGIVRGEGTVGQLLTNRTLYDELSETLTRTNSLLVRLQSPRGTFGRLMDDPALYNTLVGTLASLDTTLTAVNSREGSLGLLMRDTTLYHNLVGITTRVETLTSLLTEGDGTAAMMLRDQQLYDQLLKLVTDLNTTLEDLRRNPGRYTRGLIRVF